MWNWIFSFFKIKHKIVPTTGYKSINTVNTQETNNKLTDIVESKPQSKQNKTLNSEFDQVKSAIEQLLSLDLLSTEAKKQYSTFVFDVLKQLETQMTIIREQANGYPASPISASTWFEGVSLGNLSHLLTEHFKTADWLECEEKASALWAQAILAVCSHYRHMVGPAMLANADCQERLANKERAIELYKAIVADFMLLVDDDWIGEYAPIEEDRIAIQSLQIAVERLLSFDIFDIDSLDLRLVKQQILDILQRPIENHQDEV